MTMAQFPAEAMMEFVSLPPCSDQLWGPLSPLSNGYHR